VHRERGFVVHDVVGIGEGLQQLGGQGTHVVVIIYKRFYLIITLCITATYNHQRN
jgi:hypothetical protein